MAKPRRRQDSEPDVNQIAYRTMQQATGATDSLPTVVPTRPEKNLAAVALGLLGGSKGGKARATALSSKRRTATARKAAKARWAKTD